MRSLHSLLATTVLLALSVSPALAQTAAPNYPAQVPVMPYPGCGQPQFLYPGGQMPSGQPQTGQDQFGNQPSTDGTGQPASAPSPSAETPGGAGVGFSPAMFGDLIGGPNQTVTTTTTVKTPVVISSGSAKTGINIARPPIATATQQILTRGPFKIADNSSPRPVDRVYITYNYFDGINSYSSSTPNYNANRELIGFEKTFFSGNASVEMRLPFIQLNGADSTQQNDLIGDLTVVLKYAVLNDRQTGNVISTGLVVTAPTGNSLFTTTGTPVHDVLIQPFIGYIYNMDQFFVQGFSSLVVPSDSQDVTMFFNDVGIYYWLMRNEDPNRYLRGIVPALEAHLVTPITHAGSQTTPIGIPDYLTMTAGLYFVLPGNSTLGFAYGRPVTGPRPYDSESIVSLNIRF